MLEVFASGHESIEIGSLDDAADVAQRLLEIASNVESADRDVAGGRLDEADQHADGGRLSRTVWSEKAEDLARLELKRNVVDDGALADDFGKAIGDQNRIHTGSEKRILFPKGSITFMDLKGRSGR